MQQKNLFEDGSLSRPVDRPAAATAVPLVAWVGFATVLSTAIWRMNRR